jgi:hypothetical protein
MAKKQPAKVRTLNDDLRSRWDKVEPTDTGKGELYEPFVDEIMAENDRGCLLSSAAVLDGIIEDRLRTRFKELSDAKKDDIDFLLSKRPLPPLGSFGVRIVAARTMGLIAEPIKRTLQEIQNLRNAHAHGWQRFNFETSEVRVISKRLGPAHQSLIIDSAACTLVTLTNAGYRADDLPSPARAEYVWTIAYLLGVL